MWRRNLEKAEKRKYEMQMREKTSPSPQRQYVRCSHQKQCSSSIQHTPEGILLRVPGGILYSQWNMTIKLWPIISAGTSPESQTQPLKPLAQNSQDLVYDCQPHYFAPVSNSGPIKAPNSYLTSHRWCLILSHPISIFPMPTVFNQNIIFVL